MSLRALRRRSGQAGTRLGPYEILSALGAGGMLRSPNLQIEDWSEDSE